MTYIILLMKKDALFLYFIFKTEWLLHIIAVKIKNSVFTLTDENRDMVGGFGTKNHEQREKRWQVEFLSGFFVYFF